MTTYSITYGLTEIPFTIRYSNRAKYSRIMVNGHRVQVVAPPGVKRSHLIEFVESSRKWIYSKWKQSLKAAPIRSVLQGAYKNGGQIMYMGRFYPLIIESADVRYVEIHFNRREFFVEVPRRFEHEGDIQAALGRAFRRFFRERLEEQVQGFIDEYQKRLRVKARCLKIRKLKSRWGSCSYDGEITINEHLIHMPYNVIKYVVVHELCHLRYFDHSDKFWGLLDRVMPGYKVHKDWLSEHQSAVI